MKSQHAQAWRWWQGQHQQAASLVRIGEACHKRGVQGLCNSRVFAECLRVAQLSFLSTHGLGWKDARMYRLLLALATTVPPCSRSAVHLLQHAVAAIVGAGPRATTATPTRPAITARTMGHAHTTAMAGTVTVTGVIGADTATVRAGADTATVRAGADTATVRAGADMATVRAGADMAPARPCAGGRQSAAILDEPSRHCSAHRQLADTLVVAELLPLASVPPFRCGVHPELIRAASSEKFALPSTFIT